MIDHKEIIAQLIVEATGAMSKEEIRDLIEVPGDEKMGDYAFPCFRLAKAMRKAPPMIAKDICDAIACLCEYAD
jgi:arginyl-tRNA synthetase